MKRLIYILTFFIFLAIIPFVAGLTKAQGTDLFFSEYIEGIGNSKALEIFNPTDSSIGLNNYKLLGYFNGSSSATYTYTFGSGASINSGSTYLICNTRSIATLLNECEATGSGVLTFNGNDTIVLAKSDGTPVDVFGQIGFDPGAAGWGTGLTNTTDHTLVRKCNVNSGDPNGSDVFDPFGQWDGHDVDDFSFLGQHTLCLATPTPTVTPTGVPTNTPTEVPTATPTSTPTSTSSPTPTSTPTVSPTATPTEIPTTTPTINPTPSATPTEVPTVEPTEVPTATPTPTPTEIPTATPTTTPTSTTIPTQTPTPTPGGNHTDFSFGYLIRVIVRFYGKVIYYTFSKSPGNSQSKYFYNFYEEFNFKSWPFSSNLQNINKN